MSFAQYSAAGLFRWVHNGFKSDLEFTQTSSPAALAQWYRQKGEHWKLGLDMLTVFPPASA